jgi:hypothetical protein
MLFTLPTPFKLPLHALNFSKLLLCGLQFLVPVIGKTYQHKLHKTFETQHDAKIQYY